MHAVDKRIWEKFHYKPHDNMPMTPWLEGASRIHLAELFGELGFRRGAEVGVRSGQFSQVLCEKAPGLELLCIDPWAPYNRVSQEKQDGFFHFCQKRLAPYNATLMRMTSMEAVDKVQDASLDFVYLDGRHEFSFVMMDIIKWNDKVRSGGVISGHDFYPFYMGGVIIAVEAYTRAHNINPWYVTKDAEPSWFWVKP